MAKNEALYEGIGKGNRKQVIEETQKVVDAGGDLVDLLNHSMIPAMRDIGEKFSRNEVYVPEMLIAARAMQAGLDIIEPLLAQEGHKARATIAIGTVKGDLHDIGKNLVVMMLKGAGFAVQDLGVDCSVDKFEEAVTSGANVICLSALLTTTMPYMRDVVDHFKGRNDVKIVIGGAPITQSFADEIGADAFGADANDAVTAVEKCLNAG